MKKYRFDFYFKELDKSGEYRFKHLGHTTVWDFGNINLFQKAFRHCEPRCLEANVIEWAEEEF